MKKTRLIFLLACCALRWAAAAPEPPSISSKYPEDAGIGKDPRVLFAENFESGNLAKWDDRSGSISVVDAGSHSGKFCARSEMELGKNSGGEAKKWFMPGRDRVHVRFYVKFDEHYLYTHHFVSLMGNHRTNKWSSFGKAGLKPNGTYFSSGMEPWFAWGKNPPPGEVNLYSYFLDMERDPKMDKYWGNGFFPPGPEKGTAAGPGRVLPRLNEWECWEFMIQANTAPDKADGKQAMWRNGRLAGEFPGIRWRTDPDVKVNCLWLQHYGFDGGDPTRGFWKIKAGESLRQFVWFDDVVVATDYIGPMTEAGRR